MANFEACNIHDNEATRVLAVFPCLDISSIAPMERYALCFFGLQGGGVRVDSNGVANFESCNIHNNTAVEVCLHP